MVKDDKVTLSFNADDTPALTVTSDGRLPVFSFSKFGSLHKLSINNLAAGDYQVVIGGEILTFQVKEKDNAS